MRSSLRSRIQRMENKAENKSIYEMGSLSEEAAVFFFYRKDPVTLMRERM